MSEIPRAETAASPDARNRARLAAALFFASFVLGQVGPVVAQPFGAASLFLSVPVTLSFFGLVAYFVARGKNWARILATVIVGLGLIVSVLFASGELFFVWLGIGQAVMWAAFLLFAFTAPGAAWFGQ